MEKNSLNDSYDIAQDIEFDAPMPEIDDNSTYDGVVEDSIMGSINARAGMQTQSLQSALDKFANLLNEFAIAKSTGKPVRTPSNQFKGFAAEEFQKLTFGIDALSKGIPESQFGVYTYGPQPNGETLSRIDMKSDITVWERKRFLGKPEKIADYQSKVHNANREGEYLKDLAKPQYKGTKLIGPEGQSVVDDRMRETIKGIYVESDTKTPEGYIELADQMKAQQAPAYSRAQEKKQQLNQHNMKEAVKASAIGGALSGMFFTAIGDICFVVKHKDEFSEQSFVDKVSGILCDTVKGGIAGGIEGGIRGGAIMGSIQLMSKVLGKEIHANTLGAVPISAIASVSGDFAKDLYRCFVDGSIDADDLLCNSVYNSYSSFGSFGGSYIFGQLGGKAAVAIAEMFPSVQSAVATGAAIGSPLGPLGTMIGATVGGLIIGVGTKAILNYADSVAEMKLTTCMQQILARFEEEGCKQVYYFVDSISELSEYKVSFKDLLPCFNLLSDLKEYNLRKKKIKQLRSQLADRTNHQDREKRELLIQIEANQRALIGELRAKFEQQKRAMFDEFNDSMNIYITNSYFQYMSLYDVMSGNVDAVNRTLKERTIEHNAILDCARNRVDLNRELNKLLEDLFADAEDQRMLSSLVVRIRQYMDQDDLIIGKQYISQDEAMLLVREVS